MKTIEQKIELIKMRYSLAYAVMNFDLCFILAKEHDELCKLKDLKEKQESK